MNLLQMSFSGAAFITAVVIIRAVAINKLPKSTHGVTGINGGKGKYPLNISQKKSFIHFVRQTHIS